jgi:hypothetical protein
MYYWDGQGWVTTLSADGRHRWNGETWVPVAATVYAPPPRVVREPTSWTRPLQYTLAVWFVLAALFGLSLPFWMGGVMTQMIDQSIQQQQQLYPQATPLPSDFTSTMSTMFTGVLWFAAVFTFVLYAAGVVGVIKRWTWIYYVILGLFGLGLIGLPINLLNAATGQLMSGGPSGFNLPSWFLYLSVFFGLVQAAIFVWMLIAQVKFGPWAMRKVS